MEPSKMKDAARETMQKVMNLVAQDKVLVVTDKKTESIGKAFALGAEEVGCSVDTYYLPEKERPLIQVPAEMLDCMKGKTVVLNLFYGL